MLTDRQEDKVYVVENADGIPVSEYDDLAMARSACYDLAREAFEAGDVTNAYYVRGDEVDGVDAASFAEVSR